MAYSKTNKEKIKYLKEHPELVYEEYITNKKSTYQLAEEWGLPSSTVYNICKSAKAVGIKIKDKISTCDEQLFDMNNPIFCYLAGLVSADGYLDENNHRVILRMNVDAKEMLEKLREYFKVSSEVVPYSGDGGYTHGYTMHNLTISSRKLMEELRKLNIHGRKKDLLERFPDMAKLNDECQEMFMRGLWDGDGTIRSRGYTSIFFESLKTTKMVTEYLVNELGMNIKKHDRIVDGRLVGYDLYADTKTSLIFYMWLYRHNDWCRIECKYNRQF